MSNKIVLSIRPIYAEKILNGEKRFEYRKRVAKNTIEKIYIYATSPKKEIVGEVKVLGVLALSPQELWERTKNESGIDKSFFDDYFNGRNIAYAYQLGDVTIYEPSRTLNDFGLRSAPLSFVYINV